MSISQLTETLNVLAMKVSRSRRSPLGSASRGSSSRRNVSATVKLRRGLNVCWTVPVNEGKKLRSSSSRAVSCAPARLVESEPRVFGRFIIRARPALNVVRKFSVRLVSVRRKLSVHCSDRVSDGLKVKRGAPGGMIDGSNAPGILVCDGGGGFGGTNGWPSGVVGTGCPAGASDGVCPGGGVDGV